MTYPRSTFFIVAFLDLHNRGVVRARRKAADAETARAARAADLAAQLPSSSRDALSFPPAADGDTSDSGLDIYDVPDAPPPDANGFGFYCLPADASQQQWTRVLNIRRLAKANDRRLHGNCLPLHCKEAARAAKASHAGLAHLGFGNGESVQLPGAAQGGAHARFGNGTGVQLPGAAQGDAHAGFGNGTGVQLPGAAQGDAHAGFANGPGGGGSSSAQVDAHIDARLCYCFVDVPLPATTTTPAAPAPANTSIKLFILFISGLADQARALGDVGRIDSSVCEWAHTRFRRPVVHSLEPLRVGPSDSFFVLVATGARTFKIEAEWLWGAVRSFIGHRTILQCDYAAVGAPASAPAQSIDQAPPPRATRGSKRAADGSKRATVLQQCWSSESPSS